MATSTMNNVGRWVCTGVCVAAAACAVGNGCAGGEFQAAGGGDAALDDSGARDTAAPDAPRDSSNGRDVITPPPDARPDASDARQDAADAGRDAEQDSTCTPTSCPPVRFECLPLAAETSGGLSVSADFYVAWRFQVPEGRVLVSSEVGAFIRPTVASGTLFAAIIPLDSPATTLKAVLAASDVLGSGIIALNGVGVAPQVFSVPLSVTLSPGWYAVAFGSNQLAAAGGAASIVTLSNEGCNNDQFLLSVRQDGQNILQSSAGHVYVVAH